LHQFINFNCFNKLTLKKKMGQKQNHDEHFKKSNSPKILQPQHQTLENEENKIEEEINKIKNKENENIYLNDIIIFFDFKNKKKEEIGLEDNNYEGEKNKKIKNLIQILKAKINHVVFKNEISNIGCGGSHSFIYDNSF
jgi:seryl-tRNA synthetase